jgi:hypothetical protein
MAALLGCDYIENLSQQGVVKVLKKVDFLKSMYQLKTERASDRICECPADHNQ